MKYFFFSLLLSAFVTVNAQDTYQRMPYADVQHYVFELTLSDSSNRISGHASVTVAFTELTKPFYLDLVGKNGEFGMEISEVTVGGENIDYEFSDNRLTLPALSDTVTYEIMYAGIAERGLVINQTKYGVRSFFGDNWPILGRHWLPSVDHPYDKASVEFIINAPGHYDVIAAGAKKEESYLSPSVKRTHYIEPAPVAVKVMTIGVTRFASTLLGYSYEVPVSAWVYPENRLDGFYDYSMAIPVMDYFIENIGPYSFAKLANMQAKTQWGGLENAGTIAYNENSVDGKRTATPLIAHEIAHQWFGNSASEADWNHVWLSEGFATYFSILFLEHLEGANRRKQESSIDRDEIIAFYQRNPSPIVDLSIKDPMRVLNTNSYQKGGWVLHMLRVKLGDERFWQAIRTYYARYRNSNAMTSDLQEVFEAVAGEDLTKYFEQWVFTEGFPELKIDTRIGKKSVDVTVDQVQEYLFEFPLEIGLTFADGTVEIHELQVSEKSTKHEFSIDRPVSGILVDPNVNLLFRLTE